MTRQQQPATKPWTAFLSVTRYVRHDDTWEVRVTDAGLAAGWTPAQLEEEVRNEGWGRLSIERGLILDGDVVVARYSTDEDDEEEENRDTELLEIEYDEDEEDEPEQA